MNETQYISDFLAPRDAWDKLSIEEQAAMMKTAVSEGILDLNTIRQKYNEFAEGGNTDDDLVDWIIREEGFIANPRDIGDGKMALGSGLTAQKWHDQYKRNGNKWTSSDNRRAVREEVANRRRWAERNIPNWDSLPSSSQKALLSYKYNYDFNRTNSPKLFKALADSNLQEAARQMDATSSNPIFKKGLQDRRKREQEWFLRDVASPQVPGTFYQPAVSTQVYNPYVQQAEATRILPINEPDPNSYIRTREVSPQEQRRRKFQENVEAFQRFNALMNLIDLRNNPAPSYSPIYSLFGGDSEEYANGGKIRIKPENRGKFTALKERTGHSATWFKEHGTPAQKKMAVFALNSKHWKHGDGGPLVDWIMENKYAPGGGTNPMNYEHRGTIYSNELKNQGITHVAELPEVVVTGRDLRKPYVSAYDNKAIIPFIQLADPTGITNIPNFVMDLKEDEIDWRRTALDAVSILPYFKYGKAARNGLRSFGKAGEMLSWIPTILSKGEKKGIELINKGYNKILNRSTDFVDNIRSYLDYGKGIARLSPAEDTTRGFSSLLMHYSGGHPQGIHQGPMHTLFGDNTYYTGFFKANPETDISGNFSIKDKDAISQYYYGNSNLTPYTGNKITINGKEWNYPHFNENILPVDKGDTLELTPSLQPIIEDAIQNNKFIGLNTNSLKRMSPDRKGTTMLNGRNVNTKPFKDNNGQYYLKAFDNFDFSGTVPLGTGADSYVENTRFLYPNSGPFVIVQDSIPVTFKTGGRDAAMFNDMRNSYGEYILQGQFEDN